MDLTRRLAAARVGPILERLAKAYADPTTALVFTTPFELLVSTILSAQCTDERVNRVTPGLFKRYPSAPAFAGADQAELEQAVKSTGFFRNKAKAIKGAAEKLVREFGGHVPRTMEELTTLPGVARKTANVVLGTAFGIAAGIVVDTHVRRVSERLALSKERDPEKIERDLMRLVPQERWIFFGHALTWHGRLVCQARKPRCDACPLVDCCPFPARAG